jgi:hypothetical protein
LGDRSYLSQTLLSFLRQKNITLLFQARGPLVKNPYSAHWIRSNELGITGELAEEWEHYRKALIGSGAFIQDKVDELMWTGGDNSGFLSVKNAYNALLSTLRMQPVGGWRLKLWKWDLPLKIKLFIWLAVENKILSWDNLQQKGWEGPSRCQLCKKDSENISHLFIHCSFTKLVWERIQTGQKIKKVWEGNNLTDCYKNWIEEKTVPFHITCSNLLEYLVREKLSYFREDSPSILFVVTKTLGSLKRNSGLQKSIPLRSCMVTQRTGTTVACFDGAAQADGKQCGAGGGGGGGGLSKLQTIQFTDGSLTVEKAQIQGHNYWEFGQL